MRNEITTSVLDVAYKRLKMEAEKKGISIEELATDIIEIWSIAQIATEVRRHCDRGE